MKRKYYTHDYTLPSQASRLLYDLQVKLREDKIDMQCISEGIGACRLLVDEYLSKDNLVEDEEGSLMFRYDEEADNENEEEW